MNKFNSSLYFDLLSVTSTEYIQKVAFDYINQQLD